MRMIEWPRDSGRTAIYGDEELDEIGQMISAGKEQGIPNRLVSEDLALIHDLKVELGAHLIPVPDDLDLGFDIPPESVIRLPPHVVRDRQLDLVIAARMAA